MAKNILIFSDGTGQAGGLRPDQNLSNIYKLYRASRTGPESPIDPREQVAFYDAGLGTESDGGKIPFRPVQQFRKLWSSATGTGITQNIIDCYEAVIRLYEPGDRVFLFGFSRGAYTARCVGGVMSLCGIPTHLADGRPIPKLGKRLRKIATEAVRDTYQHGSGRNDQARKDERDEKGRRFREKYGSNNSDGQANEVPYFIGVFDTVAALGAPALRRLGLGLLLAAFTATLVAGAAFFLALTPWLTFWPTFAVLTLITTAAFLVPSLQAQFRFIRHFPKQGDFKWHFVSWRFRFYDNQLNKRVRFARHALAIDEHRKDFDRVPWASKGAWESRINEPEWLKQVWFAGNHSDIGGSYPEDEARLSDISLSWMLQEVTSLPSPLQVDGSKLNLFPDARGPQHCELESMRDAYPAWCPPKLRFVWASKARPILPEAPLHLSVFERFDVSPGILRYGSLEPYRPVNLQLHNNVTAFYPKEEPPTALALAHVDRKIEI